MKKVHICYVSMFTTFCSVQWSYIWSVRRKIESFITSWDSCAKKNHSTVFHYEMSKRWVIAIPEKVKAEKIKLKIYALFITSYAFAFGDKCDIATNRSSDLTFPLHGDTKMMALRRRKPEEFAMRSDHQKRNSLTIFSDHISQKVISQICTAYFTIIFHHKTAEDPRVTKKVKKLIFFYQIGHSVCRIPL